MSALPGEHRRLLEHAGLRSTVHDAAAGSVHYLHRPGRGPTLLCLHGLGDSSLTWPEFLAEEPLRAYPVLAPDSPGFGLSTRVAEASESLRGQAESMLKLMDSVGVEEAVLVGHSMGGAVGVHLAEMAPERFRAFVSFEGNLTLADCSLSKEAAEADQNGEYASWRETVPPRIRAEGEAGEAGKLRFLAGWPRASAESYLEAAYALVEESTESRLGHRYAALDLPRLYLHGAVSSPAETQRFVQEQALDDVLYPGAGHWPHWDARGEAARDCAAFLSRLG